MANPTVPQQSAIAADLHPLLVVAGPGSGKTFCLIERIRFLIEQKGIAPARICAFTFTNKAAEEIATRLDQLGERAALVRRSTIHRFCVEVLREFGARVNVQPGFGIADDDYLYSVLWRLEANPRKHGKLAQLFTLHRLKGEELYDGNSRKLEKYLGILKDNNLLDFDQLLVKTAELLTHVEEVAATVRRRYDAILVDEFQDLNRVQYAIVKALGQEHRNVFAVGDFNQSIYSWAGADLKVFNDYLNDFSPDQIALTDNFRCTTAVFDLARAFVNQNTPLFGAPVEAVARNTAQFAVEAWTFDDHDAEIAAIISDINAQREQHGLGWGDFALLYRRHEVGDVAEPGLLNARIPSRLAHGRAIAEDEIVAYVAAALRVIASPNDDHLKEAFLKEVLPQTLVHELRAEAESSSDLPINRARKRMWVRDEKGRKIRRGLYAIKNFGAISKRHNDLGALIEELLSQRVGEYRTPLEREHQLISDPELNVEASALAFRLNGAINHDRPVSVPALNGAGIALKAMLHDMGVRTVHVETSNVKREASNVERLTEADGGSLGLPIALFKAAQILASRKYEATFRDFTVVDIETTGKDRHTCEIVEIAAVRVRNGKQVAEWYTRVKPRVPIELGAYNTHRISEEDVKDAPFFEQIWPGFRDFCGRDVLVAHNGFAFDFPIIERMSRGLPDSGKLPTYDTLPLAKELEPASRKLEDLARAYGVPVGKAHAAVDDCRMLAGVFSRLAEKQLARARKSAKVNLLDQLGVALALSKGELETIGVRITADHSDNAGSGLSGASGGSSEPSLLFQIAQNYALSSYSQCLEYYGAIREELGDRTIPDVQELIDALGGEEKRLRIQAQKSADERYPQAMMRLRRLLQGIARSAGGEAAAENSTGREAAAENLKNQIALFLETIALSMKDGTEVDRDRVNLLTLHSTKGLEFSRVYVVGVEDAQFLGEKASKAEIEESRRVLYVGMTRARERLVMTRVLQRGGRPTGGAQFLEEMGLVATSPTSTSGAVSSQRHAATKD